MPIPAPWQRLGSSRADQAAELGISERHYRRRLAKARAVLAEIEPELIDLPHVPIVDIPTGERYCYCLEHDWASRLPMGLMRIGDAPLPAWQGMSGARQSRPPRLEGRLRVRYYNEDLGEREPPANEPAKFRPKRPPRKKDRPA